MAERRVDLTYTTPTRWSTDEAATVRGDLTYWDVAENVLYETSRATRKWGGTSRLNSTALTGNPTVLGLFDYWRSGTSGTPVGEAVCQAGASVFKMDRSGTVLDGVWDDITGAITVTSGALPSYTVLMDRLIVNTDAATPDNPYTYTGTGNAAALGGSPPVARVNCIHANRAWMANTNANPSRVYYSASLDPTDWTGADTGSIDIDPNDGDMVLGLVSHFNRLLVFKGPNFGSIHAITGTAPTGSDAFARRVIVRGVPIGSHRSIVVVGNDVWFVGPLGIHSLANTEQFGDHLVGFLTKDINNWWRDNVLKSRINQAVGAYYRHRGVVAFSLTTTGQTTNTTTLLLHPDLGGGITRLTRGAASLMVAQGASGNRLLYAGRYSNGFVDLEDTPARQLAGGTAYTARLRTPTILAAPGDSRINLREVYVRMRPRGGSVTMQVTRDTATPQSVTFTQTAAGDVLDTGVLDSFQLGEVGGFGVPNRQALEGPCRAFQVEFQQGSLSGDLELLEFGLKAEKADDRMESP